jgi:hypothetical protein
MFNAEQIKFVSLSWNNELSLSVINVEVTLNNGDVVQESYSLLGLERGDLQEGRIYGVVGYTNNSEHRGVIGIHPISISRFAGQVKDIYKFWEPVVTALQEKGDIEVLGIRLYGVYSHIELSNVKPSL